MGRYIVTDLTRFGTPDKVCTAVVDTETGVCLRPIPYLTSANVQELNMHPGALLSGEITKKPDAINPHFEDSTRAGLSYIGPASGEEFEQVLKKTLSASVAVGFGVEFSVGQKHIPIGTQTNCSIVTIKISPSELNIHEDQFNPGKIKASFVDIDGHSFSYLPITDRGFYDYAKRHHDDGELMKVKQFIKSQDELYLRVGLSRNHQSPDGRSGYWLQVNGIYTFPDFYEEIRRY